MAKWAADRAVRRVLIVLRGWFPALIKKAAEDAEDAGEGGVISRK